MPPITVENFAPMGANMTLKSKPLVVLIVLLSVSSAPALAKGCIKGAIVGGVAGHMVGHGKMGAAAGCVVGHHNANKTPPATQDPSEPQSR